MPINIVGGKVVWTKQEFCEELNSLLILVTIWISYIKVKDEANNHYVILMVGAINYFKLVFRLMIKLHGRKSQVINLCYYIDSIS